MRIVPFSAASFAAPCCCSPVARTAGNRAGSSTANSARAAPRRSVIRIEAGTGAPKRAQAALINAKPGDVIELGEGRFDFTSTLSLDVSSVTLQGQGPDKTILSFKDQGPGTGGEGLLDHQQGGRHPLGPRHRRRPG